MTGCTTTSDHFYLPEHSSDDLSISRSSARKLESLIHPVRCRGKAGGLPPDDVVQSEEAILRDSERVIQTFHDPDPLAMVKIALAPCSPFSVTPGLMRETVALARRYGVRCHTHLAETRDEDAYCEKVYGKRPYEVMEEYGWVGSDIWFAHAVFLNSEEIRRAAETEPEYHCPVSTQPADRPNLEMFEADVPVGLGVDGSAKRLFGHVGRGPHPHADPPSRTGWPRCPPKGP